MNESIRQRYENHYTNKVGAFIREIGEVNADGIPEVHLPLWGRNYEKANLRTAFIGIDTLYWGNMAGFISEARQNLQTAIFRGETIKFRDEATFYQFGFTKGNNSDTFWNAVMEFLARFHDIPDWYELKRGQHEEILSSFVWAESNAVERWKQQIEAAGADHDVWQKLKTASEQHLDSFSAISDIFRPHVTIVMNWYADDYLDRYLPLRWETIGDHVNYAFDDLRGNCVFNIAHPRWLIGSRRSETFKTIFNKWQTICNSQ